MDKCTFEITDVFYTFPDSTDIIGWQDIECPITIGSVWSLYRDEIKVANLKVIGITLGGLPKFEENNMQSTINVEGKIDNKLFDFSCKMTLRLNS